MNDKQNNNKREFRIITVGEYEAMRELVENLNFKEGDAYV